MKLWQLIRSHLGPYRNVLMVVVVLQAIQTAAALTLPTINALLIDNGVLRGDNDYILTMGGVMLGFTLVQIVFTVGAVWYGARAAMGFGRDIRRDLFHSVNLMHGHRTNERHRLHVHRNRHQQRRKQ